MANKCEGNEAELAAPAAYALGLGEPIPFSAEHGLGLSDLHDALSAHLQPVQEAEPEAAIDEADAAEAEAEGEATRPRSPSPRSRCSWPSSAGPTSASRPWSTA